MIWRENVTQQTVLEGMLLTLRGLESDAQHQKEGMASREHREAWRHQAERLERIQLLIEEACLEYRPLPRKTLLVG